jgi:hypothetical protein
MTKVWEGCKNFASNVASFGGNIATVANHTADAADAFGKVAKAFTKVTAAVVKVADVALGELKTVNNAFNSVADAADLIGIISVPKCLINACSNKFSVPKRAFFATLSVVKSISFVGAASKLGLFSIQKVSDVAAKIPKIGATLAANPVGIIIQPILTTMYTFDIIDASMKIYKTSQAVNRAANKAKDWRDAKNSMQQQNNTNPVDLKEGIQDKLDKRSGKTPAENKKYIDKKIEKWDAKASNAKSERTKSAISIAVNVTKIAAAVLTFLLLVGVSAAGFAPAVAIVVAVAALATLGKLFYDYYQKETLLPVRPVSVYA